MRSPTGPNAVAVTLDGSRADDAALAWAAEEADHASRPLLLAHAAGHLPPHLTYAERHLAREELKDRSRKTLDDAARYVHRLTPLVQVTTVVRLLDPDALLPAIAGGATTVAAAAPVWNRTGAATTAPVLAAVLAAVRHGGSDGHVVEFADRYAARHGLALSVLEAAGHELARQAVTGSRAGSLLLLPRPQPVTTPDEDLWSWPLASDVIRRSASPVVLLAPSPSLCR